MPRFAANLSMMFTEVPFVDRFAAAANAGFSGVEYLFPPKTQFGRMCTRLGIAIIAASSPQAKGGWSGHTRDSNAAGKLNRWVQTWPFSRSFGISEPLTIR